MKNVQILATGPELIKEGIRGIEPVIQEIISQAQNEIHLTAYLITPQAASILDMLEMAAGRGVKITIVINCLESQDDKIKTRLKKLNERFSHVKIINFCDSEGRQLHAKVIICDRKKAVIGSANLSWGGMVTNYEVGVLVEGEPAWRLAQLIDFFVSLARK